MTPPRLLLLGKNGQVGWELARTLAPLGHVTAVDYPEVDFTQPDSLRQWVRQTNPTVILNAAAYTAVDQAESEPDLCHAINGTAPGVLAEEAARHGAWLIHYSTDYIFDGSKSTPYTETDTPNPLGAYGRTKLAGDEAVRQSGCEHLIFRLCWVYGARGKNFLLTMKRLAGERDTLRVVADQHGCPTWSRLIAEATAHALARVLHSTDRSRLCGTYHLAASGQTTWHRFAQAIMDSLPADQRRCQKVEAITTGQYPTPARRPAYSVLDCAKLERTFGLRLPDWHTSLNQVLET
jgi:dTDP-4-dehydrorhamnose reductase